MITEKLQQKPPCVHSLLKWKCFVRRVFPQAMALLNGSEVCRLCKDRCCSDNCGDTLVLEVWRHWSRCQNLLHWRRSHPLLASRKTVSSLPKLKTNTQSPLKTPESDTSERLDRPARGDLNDGEGFHPVMDVCLYLPSHGKQEPTDFPVRCDVAQACAMEIVQLDKGEPGSDTVKHHNIHY